jgi:hypothetical protein
VTYTTVTVHCLNTVVYDLQMMQQCYINK